MIESTNLAIDNIVDIASPEVFTTYAEVSEYFEKKICWGLSINLDVRECDPVLLRSADAIKEYVIRLCDILKVKRFQDAMIVNLGEDKKVAGYSLVQLIETSLVSGHFANATNTAYIDIFSCKIYDPFVATEFTKSFFNGTEASMKLSFRL